MNKVFTVTFSNPGAPLLPGQTDTYSFDINLRNRDAKLKSVLFDLTVYETATQKQLPKNNYGFVMYGCTVGVAGSHIGSVVDNIVSPAGVIVNSGDFILLDTPGKQLKFDSFFIRNVIPVSITIMSWDALIQYDYYASFFLELEEIE